MKRNLFVVALASALAVLPAGVASAAALPGVSGAGVTYTVPVSAGSGVEGQCTIVADRWTADYGPTQVEAQGTSPFASWTQIRCTVTKNGTTYVDESATDYSAFVAISERAGTIPVAGIQVCAEIRSQLTIDRQPHARTCANF